MKLRIILSLILISCVIASGLQNSVSEVYGIEKNRVGIYFDKHFYKIGQKVIVTIVDKNLSKHYDAIDFYKPIRGFVYLEIDDRTVSDSFASKIFRNSFKETGPHTGIFKALLKIPSTDDLGKSIKGNELRINYFDIQNHVIWHDTVTIL